VWDFNLNGISQVGGSLLVENTTISGDTTYPARNHIQAKNGIQTSNGTTAPTTFLMNNTISNFRYAGPGNYTAAGLLALSGTITATGNTFNNTDVAVVGSVDPWVGGTAHITLADTTFNDNNDTFVRVSNGSTIINHEAIQGDKIRFTHSGGTYNGMNVPLAPSESGSVADFKDAGTLPPGSAVVTFIGPAGTSFNLDGKTGNPLVIWAANDHEMEAFPTATRPGHTLTGWREVGGAAIPSPTATTPYIFTGSITIEPVWQRTPTGGNNTPPRPPADPDDPEYPPPSLPFTDVYNNAWYYGYIWHVFNYDVMQGISETAFYPHANFNRAMVAATLYRMLAGPAAEFPYEYHRQVFN